MAINIMLLQAMQGIIELGTELDGLQQDIVELNKEISYWKNSANELQRKLESSEKVCANEAYLRTTLEAKLEETLKVNENLRVARNEECTKYEKVCGELTETIEQLEAATELNNSLRNIIKDLEAAPAEGGKHRG